MVSSDRTLTEEFRELVSGSFDYPKEKIFDPELLTRVPPKALVPVLNEETGLSAVSIRFEAGLYVTTHVIWFCVANLYTEYYMRDKANLWEDHNQNNHTAQYCRVLFPGDDPRNYIRFLEYTEAFTDFFKHTHFTNDELIDFIQTFQIPVTEESSIPYTECDKINRLINPVKENIVPFVFMCKARADRESPYAYSTCFGKKNLDYGQFVDKDILVSEEMYSGIPVGCASSARFIPDSSPWRYVVRLYPSVISIIKKSYQGVWTNHRKDLIKKLLRQNRRNRLRDLYLLYVLNIAFFMKTTGKKPYQRFYRLDNKFKPNDNPSRENPNDILRELNEAWCNLAALKNVLDKITEAHPEGMFDTSEENLKLAAALVTIEDNNFSVNFPLWTTLLELILCGIKTTSVKDANCVIQKNMRILLKRIPVVYERCVMELQGFFYSQSYLIPGEGPGSLCAYQKYLEKNGKNTPERQWPEFIRNLLVEQEKGKELKSYVNKQMLRHYRYFIKKLGIVRYTRGEVKNLNNIYMGIKADNSGILKKLEV
jgi:hypothetical protein